MGRFSRPIYLIERRIMALEVTLYDGETQESLVRRFQKTIQMEGILKEFRASQTFLCKRDARIIKSKRAARRRRMRR
jgi:ribosomal protein S21